MRMYQVDAFTDRLFAGNPAAVLVLDDWLPDELLAITQENNLAETAFVKARPDGAWDLRWFAPAHEVDFCGHATLATARARFRSRPCSHCQPRPCRPCCDGAGSRGRKGGFRVAQLAPGAGIPEDPVTGSIHATLVPYWVARLGHDKLMAYQASARGGWLDCELTNDRVNLRGNAVTFMEATLSLPNISIGAHIEKADA